MEKIKLTQQIKATQNNESQEINENDPLFSNIEQACISLSSLQRKIINKIINTKKNKEVLIDELKTANIQHQLQIKRLQKFVVKKIIKHNPTIKEEFKKLLARENQNSIQIIEQLVENNINFNSNINISDKKTINKLQILLIKKYMELKEQTIEYIQLSSNICQQINTNEAINKNNIWIEKSKLFFKAFNDSDSANQLSDVIISNFEIETSDEKRILRDALSKKKLAEELKKILEDLEKKTKLAITQGVYERNKFQRLKEQKKANLIHKKRSEKKAKEIKQEIIKQSEEKNRIKAQIKYTSQTLQYVSFDLNSIYYKLLRLDVETQKKHISLIEDIHEMCFHQNNIDNDIYDI